MRHLKRIGFFLYSCLLLASGFLAHIRYEAVFYPGNEDFYAVSQKEQAPRIQAVSAGGQVISADTRLVLRKRDLYGQVLEEETQPVPSKYIGLDREGLLLCVQDEMASPVLKERIQGFVSIQVASFSPEEILLEKTYRTGLKNRSFYLSLEENRVVIWEEGASGNRSLYRRMDTDARTLPPVLRTMLVRGVFLEGEEELEKFLVSYSGW